VEHLINVPPPELKLLKIGELYMRFGPEHAWLKAAVAVPAVPGQPVVKGEVSNGALTTAEMVEVPLDAGFVTLHERCWRLAGEPKSAEAVPRTAGLHARALVEAYLYEIPNRCFDFRGLCDNGTGWLLCDPESPSAEGQRARAHLVQLIDAGRTRAQTATAPPVTVAQLLRTDDFRTFGAGEVEGRAIVRYRRDLTPALDVSGYPVLVRFTRAYQPGGGRPFGPHMDAIDRFEVALRGAVEASAAAVLTCAVVMNCSRAQYLIYARDGASTRATLEALSAHHDVSLETEYAITSDPRWTVYFEQVWPEREQG
jgi:hypothetical protein